MSEIDFDELDKAVSTLMNQHNSRDSKTADSDEDNSFQGLSPDSPNSSRNGADKPEVKTPSVAKIDEVSPQAKVGSSSSAITRRPSGRFMDVVHPSSDMRTTNTAPEPTPKLTKRVSNTLQPLNQASKKSEVDEQKRAPAEPVKKVQPIDTEVDSNDDADIDKLMQALIEPTDSQLQAQTPMESPFLSDVAVDKRPLGMKGNETTSEEPQPESGNDGSDKEKPVDDYTMRAESQTEDDRWSTEPEVDSPKAELVTPPELGAEILALESTETSPGSYQETSKNKINQEAANSPKDRSVNTRGDINPQYKSVDADTPEPSGIFEAVSEPSRPMQHDEKKKTGWLVVVLVLVSAIVGIAGGIAAWYFLLK